MSHSQQTRLGEAMNTNGHNTNGTPADDALAYTANEAAKALRISRSKFYELVRDEGVPYTMLGSRKRFPRDLLAQWLTNRATKNDPAPAERN
jgi:excisionase family DNA binding protein